ncbi:RHS domain-containing protein [Pseudomonas xanthosomatis]|nr:RHS domain-containing protein [Pseudomonas xanthosomatis]
MDDIDCQHRLSEALLPNGQEAKYRYDAFGRRIEKDVAGALTEFFWQGERFIGEWSPVRCRSYVYEPGSFRPLVMVDSDGPENARPYYFQLDHLGTPQELTSAQGGICWSARYKAYGNVAKLDIEQIDNPLRFQGQHFDAETGLHYNRHRYYNPCTGRYLTADPIKLAGGLNSYRYVPNPTGWVDPLGLTSIGYNCPDADKVEAATEAKAENSLPVVSGGYRELVRAGAKGPHHIIQDAAVKDLPGYDRNVALSVQLPGPSTKIGTPHYIATQVQRQKGGGTYMIERRTAYKALRKAGISRDDARGLIKDTDAHFEKIGVEPNTKTRIPGNRKK